MPGMKCARAIAVGVVILGAIGLGRAVALRGTQLPPAIRNGGGMRLMVAEENMQPTVRIVLPGQPDADRTITVIFPEHVTTKRIGSAEGEHLYLWQPGLQGTRPEWRETKQALSYEKDFEPGVHIVATATLEEDGVRFRYEFTNGSSVSYEMIYAVADRSMMYCRRSGRSVKRRRESRSTQKRLLQIGLAEVDGGGVVEGGEIGAQSLEQGGVGRGFSALGVEETIDGVGAGLSLDGFDDS
jgi:hypothetical protein